MSKTKAIIYALLAALAVMICGSLLVVADTLCSSHAHMHTHTYIHTHDGTTHMNTVSHSHVHNHFINALRHSHHHAKAHSG